MHIIFSACIQLLLFHLRISKFLNATPRRFHQHLLQPDNFPLSHHSAFGVLAQANSSFFVLSSRTKRHEISDRSHGEHAVPQPPPTLCIEREEESNCVTSRHRTSTRKKNSEDGTAFDIVTFCDGVTLDGWTTVQMVFVLFFWIGLAVFDSDSGEGEGEGQYTISRVELAVWIDERGKLGSGLGLESVLDIMMAA